MNKKEKAPNELLQDYINIYLGSGRSNVDNQDELEVRFATNRGNPLSKIDFDNIIEKIKSVGFKDANFSDDARYTLNIQNEFIDQRSGRTKMSNIRTTISGIHNIQKYCKTNTLNIDSNGYVDYNTTFMQKFPKRVDRENEPLRPIDFHDFHFRVNYKTERKLTQKKQEIENLIESWRDTKKVFRFIKRYSFTHSDTNGFPFRIDCSIVKTSNKKRYFIPEYNIEDSNVFKNPENYEIEIEMLNTKRNGSQLHREQQIPEFLSSLRGGIKIILSGWQQSNFPISFREQKQVLTEYIKLIYENHEIPERRTRPSDFIGPSSISLEMPNILENQQDVDIPNINNPYTVTDKADGARKLLFISKLGKIYFIDVNMNVQFTGNVTRHKTCMNSILDGEHVLHDRNGNFINQYLCFDIYFKNKENLKAYPFVQIPDLRYVDNSLDKTVFRLAELNKYIKSLDDNCVIKDFSGEITIKTKTFYTNIDNDIFSQCKIILDGEKDGTMFPYETDGLIFTPCDKSVGSDKTGEFTDPRKITWQHSMKWKPAQYNTIDFLVRTKKTETGEDFIGNVFQEGNSLSNSTQINQYKTLILHVGFDERSHGYLDPCEDVVKANYPKYQTGYKTSNYRPMPFYPHDPTPNYPIYLCNIMLKKVGSSTHLTDEKGEQIFEDNTIVEFKFNKSGNKFWQWIPIRVRYDKTADYKSGRKNFGNAYHVANSVWKSIHNPVTETMITTGEGIVSSMDENVYYNRTTNKTSTRGLRDFHNKYIKRKLIVDVSNRGDTLIDMTVGKAGDLPKWVDSKLSFVFGLDISKDNIENRIDGACARFLNYKKRYRSMPSCLFVQANSSLNIKTGKACYSEKGKRIISALSGEGPKDEELIGKGVYKQYGKGKDGYNIVSNQFSIHYFFENLNSFHNFMRNVSENCKVGGYFIGTCYNGERIFKQLSNKKKGESIFVLDENDKKIWDIKKQYTSYTFEPDESSLGYEIDVYQESINKTFTEYLVNFKYLTRTLENYGFVPISDETAKQLGFPSGVGSFAELYELMEDELLNKRLKKVNIGSADKMTSNEKKISFLNNYFIFKKVRNPNAEEISMQFMDRSEKQELQEDIETALLQESKSQPKKRKVKKYKKKVKLPK